MEALEAMYEMSLEAHGELRHNNPFELLIAVILSAQAIGISVNKVTPDLLASFPTPDALTDVLIDEIILKIKTIDLYRNKAKSIKAYVQQLVERPDEQVPTTGEELVSLPGVGRKTVNIILGDVFGIPAVTVGTHVKRVSRRLRVCRLDALIMEVEETLVRKVPQKLWAKTHHTLIFLGRYYCTARNPKHEMHPLLSVCQDGGDRMRLKEETLKKKPRL